MDARLDDRMRVARVVETFHPHVTGPANQARGISRELLKLGVTSTVFTTDVDDPVRARTRGAARSVVDGVVAWKFPVAARFMRFAYSPSLYRALKEVGVDLIHAHNYRGHPTHAAWAAAKRRGLPFVLNTHGSLLGYEGHLSGPRTWVYRGYDLLTGKRVVLDAARVVASSRAERRDALRFGVPREKVEVVPMGIDVGTYGSKTNFREVSKADPLRVLCVGRLSRLRNVELVLRALAGVQDATLKVVGGEVKHSALQRGGYLKHLERLADRLGVSSRVAFVGPKYGEQLLAEYRAADCFAFASFTENFGQTMLEAAAAGLPLACTPVGVAPELVEEGRTGFLVDARDPEPLRVALERMKSASWRRAASGRLQRRVAAKFGWEAVASAYLRIYEECTS